MLRVDVGADDAVPLAALDERHRAAQDVAHAVRELRLHGGAIATAIHRLAGEEARRVGLRREHRGDGAGQRIQPHLEGPLGHERRRHGGPDALDEAREDAGVERVLRLEVVEERGLPEADALGEVTHAGALVPALREELRCFCNNLFLAEPLLARASLVAGGALLDGRLFRRRERAERLARGRRVHAAPREMGCASRRGRTGFKISMTCVIRTDCSSRGNKDSAWNSANPT